jgi:hypothetical protein
MTELPKPLDTASLEDSYGDKAIDLPVHEQFGSGRRFPFGPTNVDVFSAASVVRFGLRRATLTFGEVEQVTPTPDNGLQVLRSDIGIDVNRTGDLAMVYSSPLPEMEYVEIEDRPIIRRDARGTEHVQEMLPETEQIEKQKYLRVELIVGSKPVAVNRRKGAPVRLTAYQKLNPQDTTDEKVWEVKAYGDYVAKVKDLQPGWKIFGIFAHKQWTNPKAGGGFIEAECLNVAGPITILDKGDNRQRKQSGHTKQAN